MTGSMSLQARLARSRYRGNALFAALLAVGLLAILALGLSDRLVRVIEEDKEVGAARKLAVLGQAVESYVHSHYGTLAAGSDVQIAVVDLQGEGLLPDGFSGDGDAMKRALRVWVLPQAGGRLRVASMQLVEAGDDRYAAAGLFEARGRQALGLVETSDCPAGVAAPCLLGPAIAEEMAEFQAADLAAGLGGHPREFALVVYQEFDREGVCGDWLLRRVRPGCPDGGVMETALDMGGNDLVSVGRLEAEDVQVSDEFSVLGNWRIDGELAVGTSLNVTGGWNVPDGLVFTGAAEFTGLVRANEVDVTRSLEAETASVEQTVAAGSVTTQGNLTAPNVTATTFDAGSGAFNSLSVGICSGCQ